MILIDDARLFLSPPHAPHEIEQWPRFQDLISLLTSLGSGHAIMVVNDVIVLFPKEIEPVLVAYARQEGIDWLAAANAHRDSEALHASLRQKEEHIQHQARDIQVLHEQLREKEVVIEGQISEIERLNRFNGSRTS